MTGQSDRVVKAVNDAIPGAGYQQPRAVLRIRVAEYCSRIHSVPTQVVHYSGVASSIGFRRRSRPPEIYSVGPRTTGSGLNITVWSYVDRLNISVRSDGATVDDPTRSPRRCWPISSKYAPRQGFLRS